MKSTVAAATIYANAFLIGAVLMGFEMLGSRYLFPYFGGGIGTWAALISTVLIALTVGYFCGGALADRYPTPLVIAAAAALAAVYLAGIPQAADPVMLFILDALGDGPGAVLLASTILLLLPMTLLGTLSPVAVRILVRSTDEVGRIAGRVYGVSTLGNVSGVLVTTFVLIPEIGSRAITYLFASLLVACAATLFLVRNAKH